MFVLDTSAVLALLLGENGADVVAKVTREAELSLVNLSEVFTKTAEAGGDLVATDAILVSYGIRVRAFREAHAMEVGRLRPLTAHLGLSLADRACLAQGHFSQMPIFTANHRMADADVGLDIRLIR